MKKRLIRWLGGFPDVESAIQHVRDIHDEGKKREILTEAVKHLYRAIDANELLQQNADGSWQFRGKPIMGTEVAQLKEEAAFFRQSRLWVMIKQDVKYHLGKRMYEEGQVPDDFLWGKLATFLWDVVNTRLNKM